MKVTLSVIKGPQQGRVMEFTAPCGVVVGRSPDAQVHVPDDPYVSRRHVYFEVSPPHCRLRDLGSTNPTHVNGEVVVERDLRDGDVIEVGYTELQVSISGIPRDDPHGASGNAAERFCPSCGEPLEPVETRVGNPAQRKPAVIEPAGTKLEAPGPAATDPAAIEPAGTKLVATSPAAGKPGASKPAAFEPPVKMCAACVSIAPASPAGSMASARCFYCGADLGDAADWRVPGLADVAIYSCQTHLRPDAICADRSIGNYDVCRVLGEGAMGIVYLVYERATARLWALKRIKDLRSSVLARRFQREIQLMQRMVHRNIVRCMYTGIDEQGVPYLVTEYMPDGALEDLVQQRGGVLPIAEAVRIIDAVLDGVEYLHGHGIIHRDLKPANILLRGGDGVCVPKLADLGIAKSYSSAGGTWRTKPGTRLGTLMFMPPEQVLDAGKVGVTADIYSAGVTLYYLLTGSYSFDFPSPAEALLFQRDQGAVWNDVDAAVQALMRYRRIKHPFSVILEEDPIPVGARNGSIPAALARVVDRAVAKDPGARYQSVAEFRCHLEAAL